MTRECISLILELMAMFLSFQMTFSLVIAVVVWAILESTSGLDPSSDTIAPRYLKLRSVSSFLLSMVMSVLMLLVLFVINWVFSTLICMPYAVEASARWFINLTSSCSSPARSSMSSAVRKFVIVLPPILIVPSWSSSASAIILRRCWRKWGRTDILGILQLWFGSFLLCCCHGRLHWSPCCRGILWLWSGWHWCYTASRLPTKLHAELCWTPSWSPWRHGKDFAGVAQSILRLRICSVVLLPTLKPACSSLIISSACGFSLSRRILCMTLLGWLIGLLVR